MGKKGLSILWACFLTMSMFADYEAYVNNYDSNTVSVVSLPGGIVVDTIPVGINPNFIANSPDMKTVYVVNNGDSTISVIDTATHLVIATIPVGTTPYFLAITPDGSKIYVPNYGDNTVSVIDTATNTVINTVSVGGGPYGIVILPNGEKVYITNFGDDSVNVIATATDSVIATFAVGINPYPPAATFNSAFVYVPNDGDGTVSIISTSSDTVISTLSMGGSAQSAYITPDGTKAYIPVYSDDFIYIINTTTNTSEGVITVGINPFGVAFSADGTTAYVGNYSDGTISVINIASAALTSNIPSSTPNLYTLALTPDKTQIGLVYFNLPGSFDLFNPSTNSITNSATTDNNPSYVAFGLVPPVAPTNLKGSQGKNRFLTQTDIFNRISWSQPTTGPKPTFYNIYRGNLNTLIGTVSGAAMLEFIDNNRAPHQTYIYYVRSVDADGNLSNPASITVSPNQK